jgi:NTE family protein
MPPRDSVILSVHALLDLDREYGRPPVNLLAGEWLFHQGDPSDAAYVLESGRLEVIDEAGGHRQLRVVPAGTVVGELSLLSGRPRAAGIRALRDSTLTVLPQAAFERLVDDQPGFGLSLARALARALRESTETVEAARPPATVAVLGFGAAPAASLASELCARLGDCATATVFDRDAADPKDWGARLDEQEDSHAHVLLPAGADAPEEWREFCLRQADRILAIAAGDPPSTFDPRLIGCDLALDPALPTEAWISAFRPRRTHLTGDLDRLARKLAGRAVGVVLSGGGARGLAHIGVLAELERAGVVIDRVGGCSMGAMIGALYAQGRDPDEIAAACRGELVRKKPFNDYTVPRTSLIRAQRAEAMLGRLLGQGRIECMPRSYFCVSADLITADLVVLRDGPVRDAVLASMSVPGVMPPRRVGDRLLVDGGVLANLPLEPMNDGAEGPAIAVDAMGRRLTQEDERPADARPRILEILARASVLGSWRQGRLQAEEAALTIRPEPGELGLLDFGRMDEAIAAGREAAAAALAGDRAAALTGAAPGA